ncbi:MAG TPA: NifU family protein [Myxococcota bacterium]|nr:NifU family protein [Myxococcota bacterium]HRY94813.1 NifU family protein [Myxococcota bacterium]HSA22301.1 NifU family protein [Myxococcota bacterium]
MQEKIQAIIEEKIRPYLEADGGGIEFVSFDEATGEVRVRLKGACAGCPGARMTLSMGVEAALKEELPQVKSVVAV